MAEGFAFTSTSAAKRLPPTSAVATVKKNPRMTAYATQCLSFRKANLALFFTEGPAKRVGKRAFPYRAELFPATFAAGGPRAASLARAVLAHLRLVGVHL